LLTFCIDKFSWRATFMILGAFITLVVIVSAQFLKRDPSEVGAVPYGESREISPGRKKPVEGFNLRDALHTPQFWIVLTMLSAAGFYNMGISVHIVPDAINLGMTPAAAANILAVNGISMLGGRVILGGMADRIGNRRIFIFSFVFSATAMIWMIFSHDHWAFYVFAAVIGFTQGGVGVSQSPVTASLFGLKYLGLILGCIGFGSTIGMALGPYIMGYIFDVTGSYQMAFVAGSFMGLMALACAFLIRPHKNVKLFAKL
jgi:predicted MFS family arabinose efflux permease